MTAKKWTVKPKESTQELYQEIHDTVYKSLHKTDDNDSKFLLSMFAPFTSVKWMQRGELKLPVWVIAVASPGSGKTKRLDYFNSIDENLRLSVLTPNALMSGFRDNDGEDPSLLLQLDGKVLTIKDMTALYQQPKEGRDAVLGQLRDAYDGNASKATGATGLVEYTASFNLLGMITHIYDSFLSVSAVLGERFIPIRLFSKATDFPAHCALRNLINCEHNSDHEIQTKIRKMIKFLRVPKMADMELEEQFDYIIRLSDIVCRMRSHVERDPHSREICTVPQLESNTRLASQYMVMLANRRLLLGRNIDDEREYLAWIARCGVPMVRLHILHHLYRHASKQGRDDLFPYIPFGTLLQLTGVSRRLLDITVNDFRFMGLVEGVYTGNSKIEYRLAPEIHAILKHTDFFAGHDWRSIQPDIVKDLDSIE